ncbi:NADH-quinone oxidoreductase subunit NuoG [Sandaracinobacteroides saxicola]|uniref:NADH-quinone oxidoreductase n=1 Tax=Sandaracinobacteroides saxicola TaxID=2759707 RepID=A0A7G5IEQ4_9SPHN|nr:NADH-quinone oxidoreductase subunit NuoG [Sandaracinobacteroides saxicola]QMW21846.1 NADH-quinone oxidoreductase subunit G [Sandaracinobacteroides saxicola]
MPKLMVDDIEVEVPAGATVLQACEAAGREIPRFCYHERLSIAGNCRMCLVEQEKAPKPIASCAMPAADNMVIRTNTPKVKKAREGVMEFLLINHPLDCPICDQGGECDLQDQAMAYGRGFTRFDENKRAVTEKYMGPLIKTVMTRCIHCTRCVRFAEEVAGVEEIGALYRGENMQITSYLEAAVTSEVSGNVIDLCPVGALTAKPLAFEYRPWELKRTDGIDVMDAVGSNIVIGTRSGAVMRVTPRLNEAVNEEWISDKTRFAIDGLMARRLDTPWVRRDGKLVKASWAEAFAAVKAAVAAVPAGSIGALAGDLCAVEEMVALKDLMTGLGSPHLECRLDGGAMETADPAAYRFNTTFAGLETADVILLVGTNPRAEAALVNTRIRKAVRKGGARVFNIGPAVDLTYAVEQLGDDVALLAALPAAVVDALKGAARPVLILGTAAVRGAQGAAVLAVAKALADAHLVREGWNGYNLLHTAASRVGAMDVGFATGVPGDAKLLFLLGVDEVAPKAASVTTVYVGTHGDAGARDADIILPGAAYTEKSGTWVNMEGRVQRGLRATFPPGEAREDWTIFRALSDVLGVRLPYDSLEALRARISAEWPHLGTPGLSMFEWQAGAVAQPLTSAAIPAAVGSFYLSNPIARASRTMADCVREIVDGRPAMLEAAE